MKQYFGLRLLGLLGLLGLIGLILSGLLSFYSISLAEEGKWTKKAEMLTARGSLSTSAVGGKIYAIGGTGLGGVLATVEEYDLGFAGEGVGVKAKGKLPTSWGKIKSNHEILKQHEKHEKRPN